MFRCRSRAKISRDELHFEGMRTPTSIHKRSSLYQSTLNFLQRLDPQFIHTYSKEHVTSKAPRFASSCTANDDDYIQQSTRAHAHVLQRGLVLRSIVRFFHKCRALCTCILIDQRAWKNSSIVSARRNRAKNVEGYELTTVKRCELSVTDQWQ